MVQMKLDPNLCDLKVEPLSGVDINNAAAKLQSRGDVSDNNIFEILPRFSIAAGETNQDWDSQYTRKKDEVLAVTGGGDVAGIVIGCELLAFERDKDEPTKQLHFPATIDFVVWRRSILLIGLASSEIILVDPNTYESIFRWQAMTKTEGRKRFFVDAFIHSNPDPTKIDVIVVSHDGLVCTFREIALSDGTLDATHDQNVSVDVDLGSIKDVSKHSLSITSKISCVCSPTRNNLIVVEQSGNILIVDLLSNVQSIYAVSNLFFNINLELMKTNQVTKKVAAFEGSLFILMSNGVLEIFTEGFAHTSKPLTFPGLNASVYDFALVRNNNEGTVKLWALFSTISNSAVDNYVGIFGGPTFTLEFNFQLPVFNKSTESSGFQFPKNVSPFEEPSTIVEVAPDSILMYHILETSTDVTLQKLLSRGKYLEAEDLARQYCKDLDIVRKAEARDKLSKIIASQLNDVMSCIDSLWKELLTILKEINDAEFVCLFCVAAQVHRVEWVKEILGLGKGRVSECLSTKAANLLLLTLKKFYTFELVYPSGTINEWKSFISQDNTMFLQSMKFLQNNHFEKCERIWRRHSEEFIPDISLKEFLPFFNTLFDNQLRAKDSVSLFKTILPFSVEKLVESVFTTAQMPQTNVAGMKELDVLLGMIQRQVYTLESKVDWPFNALQFIDVLSSVIKDEIKRLEASRTEDESFLQKKIMIVQQISLQLDRLRQILKELAELKRNHSIRILFHDYTNNDIPEVINKLLYKLLSQEEVEGFVSKYLRPYAERERLDVDYLFSEHIKSVLQYTHYFIQVTNIPHEERIVCLVNLISSTKTKLECALQISQEWPVPWTPGIAGMVEQILRISRNTLDHDCTILYDNIVTMQKQVPYRCVINKYKLNSSKLCSRRAYVSMALLRILKLKKPGYLEDCIELLKHVPSKTLIDEVHLEYIESILRMYDEKISEEDVLPSNMDPNGNFRKALLQRMFIELQIMEKNNSCDIYSEKEQQRCIKIYNVLANESKDARMSILCKLKQFIPSIPLDIIYDSEFPYGCLTNLFEAFESGAYLNDLTKLINSCKQLSRITKTYLPDILIIVGSYLVQVPGSPDALLWSIVEHIVKTPLNLDMNNTSVHQEMLQSAAFQFASSLMLLCPDLSLEQMSYLQDFMCRLCSSFDKICIEISHLLCFLRIFFNMKEQEIPLEHEFMDVYKWCAGSNAPVENIRMKLNLIGDTLLKFGERDLCFCAFKAVQRHLETFLVRMGNPPALLNHYSGILDWIRKANGELNERLPAEDNESDTQMKKLVRDLNEAGVRVNVYALKIRNKLKLLERLLNQEAFILAGELALTFKFFDNLVIWSRILEGLVKYGNLDDLRRVLERARTVTQLWMLPEFSLGWKKVSEKDGTFLDLCPIPLE